MTDPRDGDDVIVFLTDGDPVTAERVGPKAANLAKLHDAGLPVPDGFCLTADAYRAQLAAAGVEDAARRGEDVRDLETLLRGADGAELHVMFSASPLRDPRGKVVGAVAVGRDVTAARAAERERERLLDEVQRRAAELEATVSAIAEGLIVNRPDGQILRMNRAAELTLGLTMEEMGKPYQERIRMYQPHDAQGRPIPPE